MLPTKQCLIKEMNHEDPGNYSLMNVLTFTYSTDHRFAEISKISSNSFIDSEDSDIIIP